MPDRDRSRDGSAGAGDGGGGAPRVVEGTASWGRRLLALLIDWFACTLVVIFFVGTDAYYGAGTESGQSPLVSLATPLTYWLEASLLVSLVGGSFGQLVCRLRVVQLAGRGGRPLPLLLSLVRHLLVLLVIPPLVFRPDGRGLHDLATGSAVMPLAWVRARSAG